MHKSWSKCIIMLTVLEHFTVLENFRSGLSYTIRFTTANDLVSDPETANVHVQSQTLLVDIYTF